MSAPLRIVLTGPESTGKTELARALAERFVTDWSPEYVREYAEACGSELTLDDHEPIARGQMAGEDAAVARAAALGADVVLLDTDLVSTAVYCEHYYGHCPPWIEETARARRAALYLLLDVDVPWVPDVVRDRADRRDELLAEFRDWLERVGARWALVSGNWQVREEKAVELIDELRLQG